VDKQTSTDGNRIEEAPPPVHVGTMDNFKNSLTQRRSGVRVPLRPLKYPHLHAPHSHAAAQQTGCAQPTDLATAIIAIKALRTALNAYGLTTVV